MPDTLTQFFGFTKPALHSTGWGPKANTDFDQWDSVLGIPRAAFVAPVIGATTNLDLSLGSAFRLSLTQATTFAILNPAANPAGVTTQVWQRFALVLVGDGTRRVVTWPGTVSWLSGQVPVLTPTGTDFFWFFSKDNGVTWLGLHESIADLPPFTTPTYNASGTTTLDLNTGRQFKYTVVTGGTTVVFANPTLNTPSFRLAVTNGGLFTQTWPGSVTWLSGQVPTLQSAGTDILQFYSPDGGTTWFGAHLGVADTIANTARVKAIRSASLAIAQNVVTVIPLTAANSYGPTTMHDPGNNPSRVIVPDTTWAGHEAEIDAQVTWDTNQFAADVQTVSIRKNANGSGSGGTEVGRATRQIGNDGIVPHTEQVIAHDASPASGDYYEVFINTTRSGGFNVTAAALRLAKLI